MAQIDPCPELTVRLKMEISLAEGSALEALAIKYFGELCEGYILPPELEDHREAFRSLFSSVRRVMPIVRERAERAEKAFD
jgi:hypothetical protein